MYQRQTVELAAKCSSQMQESEHFRNLHLVGLNKCDQLVREGQMLYQKLNASEKEREKLRQDYEAIIFLREQEKKEMNELRSKRSVMWNSESNEESIEELRAMNEKLVLELRRNVENHQGFVELQKQLSEVNAALESSEKEKAYLTQQYAVTKRSLDKYVRENEMVIGRVHQAEQHRDAAVKETDQALALQLKATRELTKLKVRCSLIS